MAEQECEVIECKRQEGIIKQKQLRTIWPLTDSNLI